MGEGPQDVAGFDVPAGDQGQAFQADHGVAAPVGEPMIAGDDGADFVAGGLHAGGVLDAARRRDDELVGGQHQLARQRGMARPRRLRPAAAPRRSRLGLRPLRPGTGPAMVSQVSVDATRAASSPPGQIDAKIAGAPQVALRIVAAAFFHAVKELCRAPAAQR